VEKALLAGWQCFAVEALSSNQTEKRFTSNRVKFKDIKTLVLPFTNPERPSYKKSIDPPH
jgi:hypothetical protein